MKQKKFILLKGSYKTICPKCGQKTFVPFVDKNNNIIEGTGRCDRENNCKCLIFPEEKYKVILDYSATKEPEPTFIDIELVNKTNSHYENQILFKAFENKVDKVELLKAFKRYKVGTTKDYQTIFWQIDGNDNVRTGKIMNYLPNGHRDKNNFGTWVHKKLNIDNFNLKQCFFGEHLLNEENKSVAIVESEKTAILMSIIDKSKTWLATGGCSNLNQDRLAWLVMCRNVTLYPDKGMFSKWREKVQRLYNMYMINIDKTLELDKNVKIGADILDIYFD